MKKENLIIGAIYEVSALGFSVAIWTGEDFKGPARGFGKLYFTQEQPYWNGLPFGTCTPIRRLGELKVLKPFDGTNLLAVMNALDEVIVERERGLLDENTSLGR